MRMIGICLMLLATPQNEQEAEQDSKLLQGQWEVVSMMQGGKEIPGLNKEGKLYFHFREDKLIVKLGDKVMNEGTFKIDARKSPRTIDIIDARETTQGVYQVKGDEVILCMGGRGRPRPKEFAAAAGTTQSLVTLKRVK